MKSNRLTAQVGLLAAAAVLVTSVGMLVSTGGTTSQAPAPIQAAGASSHQTQTPTMTLSAAASADPGTAVAVQR